MAHGSSLAIRTELPAMPEEKKTGRVGRPRKQENEFSRWIKESLKADGTHWTSEEVCEYIGISLSQLDHIRSGRSVPSLRVAVKIEELTGGRIPCGYWVKHEKK
jgi:transcriptional regulator with XRE-family HTH domain